MEENKDVQNKIHNEIQNEILNSSKAPEPVGLYPHARKVGNLLFLSGVGPRERGNKQIPGVELSENGAHALR